MIRVGFRSAWSIVVLAVLGTGPAHAAVAPYRPPSPVVRTLSNGLTVAVFSDHRLPIVQAALLVPAGSIQANHTPRMSCR